jgi:hypothetical protein
LDLLGVEFGTESLVLFLQFFDGLFHVRSSSLWIDANSIGPDRGGFRGGFTVAVELLISKRHAVSGPYT